MFLPPVRPVAPVQVPAKRVAAPVFPVRQFFFVWKETKKNTTDVISIEDGEREYAWRVSQTDRASEPVVTFERSVILAPAQAAIKNPRK